MMTAVEGDLGEVQAFGPNHDTPISEADVIDCLWLRREPADAVCVSPPCPAFSALRGTPGLTENAASHGEN